VEVCSEKNQTDKGKRNNMNLAVEKRELQRQIDALLAKPSMTASERKACDALLSKVADIRGQEDRQARLNSVLAETRADVEEDRPEYRNAKYEAAFRCYMRTADADATELRTYSPEDSNSGSVLIPQSWSAAYGERLKAFVGIREAGATVISTSTGNPYRLPFSDDTATDGLILAENLQMPLANPTFSTNPLGAFNFVSQGVQVSNQLIADAVFDLDAYLQNIFAKRIGRAANSAMTLGTGGLTGVLPAITNIIPGAAAGLIGLGDLVALQSCDEGYLPTAKYMFNGVTERLLKNAVGSDGRRLYPEMNEGMLLGYPYVRNNSMASPASNSLSVVFGSFKFGVTIREVKPNLIVKKERYAEQYTTFYALIHRQDVRVTDPNALTVLQQHV
jgi:HK97 family phage major capsid protein